MPLLKINAIDGKLTTPDGGPVSAALDAALAAAPDAPIVVMIHGFKFTPREAARDPHRHILSLTPASCDPRAVSWPRRLGATSARRTITIGFGWDGLGTIWQAARRATAAGEALAALVEMIGGRTRRPVGVFAHSLGARVFLHALHHMSPAIVGRAVLMAGAAFRSEARAGLDTRAGRVCDILNVTSRENDLFDAVFEMSIRPFAIADRAIGSGLGREAPGWLDIQIDHEATRRSLAALGFRIPPPERRVCHWSTYLRPGVFRLYRALLTEAEPLSLTALRAALPDRSQRRWSRLFTHTGPVRPLPRGA